MVVPVVSGSFSTTPLLKQEIKCADRDTVHGCRSHPQPFSSMVELTEKIRWPAILTDRGVDYAEVSLSDKILLGIH